MIARPNEISKMRRNNSPVGQCINSCATEVCTFEKRLLRPIDATTRKARSGCDEKKYKKKSREKNQFEVSTSWGTQNEWMVRRLRKTRSVCRGIPLTTISERK